MPYIPDYERWGLDKELVPLTHKITEPGHLAYVVYQLMQGYWANSETGEKRFSKLTQIVGTIVSTLLRFHGQVIEPYEDDKRAANGEVFSPIP